MQPHTLKHTLCVLVFISPSLHPVCLHPVFSFFIFIFKCVYPSFLIGGYMFLLTYLSSRRFFPSVCVLSFSSLIRHSSSRIAILQTALQSESVHLWCRFPSFIAFVSCLTLRTAHQKLPSRYASKDWLDLTRWASGTKRHSSYKLVWQHTIYHSKTSSWTSLFSRLSLFDCILFRITSLTSLSQLPHARSPGCLKHRLPFRLLMVNTFAESLG